MEKENKTLSNVNCCELINVRPNCVSQVLRLNYNDVNI